MGTWQGRVLRYLRRSSIESHSQTRVKYPPSQPTVITLPPPPSTHSYIITTLFRGRFTTHKHTHNTRARAHTHTRLHHTQHTDMHARTHRYHVFIHTNAHAHTKNGSPHMRGIDCRQKLPWDGLAIEKVCARGFNARVCAYVCVCVFVCVCVCVWMKT